MNIILGQYYKVIKELTFPSGFKIAIGSKVKLIKIISIDGP